MDQILIVDDDLDVLKMLKDFLELEGYKTLTSLNAKEALSQIAYKPDLILLDINMPGMNGLDLCRLIRNQVSCPIVFLTANAKEGDRIEGLVAGGDDYIVKPFSLKELSARIMAHIRRDQRVSDRGEMVVFGGFHIAYDARKFFFMEHEVELTKTEFDILSYLSKNPGQILSKDQIYEYLWGIDKFGDSTIIVEHVRRIRKKISELSDKVLIETVWGVGYRFSYH